MAFNFDSGQVSVQNFCYYFIIQFLMLVKLSDDVLST